MKIFKELVHIENTAVGLGFFDGVHLGHRELIVELVKTSNQNGLSSVILTFKQSPAESFVDGVEYLTTNSEKEQLLENLGVDYLFELDFDSLVTLSATEYLENIVIEYFKPKYIFTGFNHTFGKSKLGTSQFLEENSRKLGYEYRLISPVQYDNKVISSTWIRSLLCEGDVELANSLLGSEYSLSGTVIEGLKIGRTIGFPTANLDYPDKKVRLPFGVYFVKVEVEGECFKGVLNYGKKPTIDKNIVKPLLEVHILDFDKNIYNKPIKLNLLKWIRKEQKFGSLEELKSQIEKDLEECLK